MKGHSPSEESIEYSKNAKPSGFENADIYSDFFSLDLEKLESSEDVKLIIVKPDRPGQKVLLLEPLTWSFIALAILQGILSGLGAKIFDSLFQEQGINIEKLISDALISISQIVSQAIAEDALRRSQASLSGLQETLLDYNNAPDSSIARLDSASVKVNDLIAEFESLGLAGFASYSLATTIRLSILQERMIRFGATGEQANINRTVDNYNKHLEEMKISYNNWIASRFPPKAVFQRDITTYWCYVGDGRNVCPYNTYDEAERARFIAAVDEFNKNWENVIEPESILREKFSALVK
jgi:hypothetical protein